MTATAFGRIRKIRHNGGDRAQKIWENLGRNNLWKRMIKNVIATTAAVGICLVPGARDALGRPTYLAPITTGVPRLPSGARIPKGMIVEEVDIYIEFLQQALDDFDTDSSSVLEGAAIFQARKDLVPDVMPREEIFLISSFLLNLREVASHTMEMLKLSRLLVERHPLRRGRRRIYPPHINWQKWLYTGGDEDERLPANGRQAARQGTADEPDDEQETTTVKSQETLVMEPKEGDIEQGIHESGVRKEKSRRPQRLPKEKLDSLGSTPEKPPLMLRVRGSMADIVEWIQTSEDALYAFKLVIAVYLVTWPAFITTWNTWYCLNRGLWAALQLVLITEVAIGTSIMTFFVRAIGTSLGCIWGWAAYEARNGNEIVCAAMICVGLIPATYVQLGTKYRKAGIVAIVSMCVVALSTELKTVPGTATENFLKRLIAFMIGGVVAVVVQVILLPVKARTRLVDALAACLSQITEMERCVAFGIEDEINLDVYSPQVFHHFERASGKAKTALSAAETFLPFCSNEPRIKGSFKGLALIYGEIIFVLHQIVDRMDNMLHLRTAYGSGPLEQHNVQIYPYRRNVAAAVTLILFAVHEALTTKLALPQFLPSARLANLRLINRVREVSHDAVQRSESHGDDGDETGPAHQRAVRRKYVSWNAAAAAQSEILEYLEELIDLTKLLVGVNEFRSGMLTGPTYRDYIEKIGKHEEADEAAAKAKDAAPEGFRMIGLTKRRSGTTKQKEGEEGQLPIV
ncbi:MAG: hypothetical protein M1830_001167 [Pleopsidium flavum]|nr:MAG: hypothetical protein M1830_001167 [Pleopsidium flavum]